MGALLAKLFAARQSPYRIAFFGIDNAGKSSIFFRLTNDKVSWVMIHYR
jgi:GTP-binding protein EngB required for normal cell division